MITQAEGITKSESQVSRGESVARKLVFMGGKGGVGATHIAVNLAVRLALKKNRVLCVDAGVGEAKVVLGIDPRYDLQHVLSGERSIEDIISQGPGGIDVLQAHHDRGQAQGFAPWQRERLWRGLAAVASTYDLVLADTVTGVLSGLPAPGPSEVVVVTTPEVASLAGACATIKELARQDPGGVIHVVVNMADDGPQAARAFKAIEIVAERFLGRAPTCLGWVPADGSVRRAGRRHVPFVIEYPDQPAAAAVEAMAMKLILGARPRGNLGFIGNRN